MIVKSLCIIWLIIQCFVQPKRASDYGWKESFKSHSQPPKNDKEPLWCPHSEYTLNPRTGSCYKLHYQRLTWKDAYEMCISEHGYLAVVNNNVEAEVLKNMIITADIKFAAFLGFKFVYTIFGETIDEAGYAYVVPPPSRYHDGLCGSIGRNTDLLHGILYHLNCNFALEFICEMSPTSGIEIF